MSTAARDFLRGDSYVSWRFFLLFLLIYHLRPYFPSPSHRVVVTQIRGHIDIAGSPFRPPPPTTVRVFHLIVRKGQPFLPSSSSVDHTFRSVFFLFKTFNTAPGLLYLQLDSP